MDLEATRRHLEERRRVLVSRTGRIESDLRSEPARDFEEYATEAENVEVLQQLGSAEHAELELIRAALRRMDAGDYGTCARCGQPIGDKRLVAMPATDVCVRCA